MTTTLRTAVISATRWAMLVVAFFVFQSAGFGLADQLQDNYYFSHHIDSMGGGLGVLIVYLMFLDGLYYGAWVFISVLCAFAAIDLTRVGQRVGVSRVLRWIHSSNIWWYLIPDSILAFASGMKLGINWNAPFWT